MKFEIRSNPARLRLVLAVMAAAVAGCGYHFGAEGTGLPQQARTIYVQRFSNRTHFTGINDEFMRYLKDEIANHKRLELVDSPAGADLILSGEIAFVQGAPLSYNAANEPTIYSHTIIANATLINGRTHQALWSSRGISGYDQYATVASSVVTTSPLFLPQNLRSQDIANLPDIQLAQTQTASSTEQVMEQLARNIYRSMSEGF